MIVMGEATIRLRWQRNAGSGLRREIMGSIDWRGRPKGGEKTQNGQEVKRRESIGGWRKLGRKKGGLGALSLPGGHLWKGQGSKGRGGGVESQEMTLGQDENEGPGTSRRRSHRLAGSASIDTVAHHTAGHGEVGSLLPTNKKWIIIPGF